MNIIYDIHIGIGIKNKYLVKFVNHPVSSIGINYCLLTPNKIS